MEGTEGGESFLTAGTVGGVGLRTEGSEGGVSLREDAEGEGVEAAGEDLRWILSSKEVAALPSSGE